MKKIVVLLTAASTVTVYADIQIGDKGELVQEVQQLLMDMIIVGKTIRWMYYSDCGEYPGLCIMGEAIEGENLIEKLSGTISVTVYDEKVVVGFKSGLSVEVEA